MIKFMRKHNKKLLAIFASGLLVVWLGSSALEEMFRPDTSDEIAGKAFGEEFDRRALGMAAVRTDVLQRIGVPWNRPWSMGRFDLPIDPIDNLTWYLLDREAERTGIQIPTREIDRFITLSRIPGKALENIRDSRGISIQQIKQCLGDYIRIRKVSEMAASGVAVSAPKVAHFVRDTRERVTVRMAVLRAKDFADPEQEVSTQAMEEHFHKYKSIPPGEGEHGYGYKWPDRVRVEYLVADVDAIEKAIPILRDEARDYWSENRKSFTKEVPVATAPSSKPATTASTTTTSTKPTTKTVIKSFDEAREEVEEEMRRKQAPIVAEKLVRQGINRMLEPWYVVTQDPNTGYKPTPPNVDVPDYLSQIAAKVRAENGFEKSPEVLRVVKPGRWLTQRDLKELEGIGKAVIEGQSAAEDTLTEFAGLAMRVENLYTPPDRGAFHRGLALYEPFNTPLRARQMEGGRNYYAFRVVAAEPSHEPKVIDEVREKVRADLIELAGLRRAAKAAKTLLAAAESQGLEAAVEANKELAKKLGDEPVVTPEPFARKRSMAQLALQLGLPLTMVWPIEELGVVEERKVGFFPLQMVAERYEPEVREFIETCFSLAPAKDATTQPSAPVTSVELPVSKQWVVVEFVEVDRVPADVFAQSRGQVQQLLQMFQFIEFVKDWYDPEQVKKRTDYEPVEEEQTA